MPFFQIRFNVAAMNSALSPIESEFATTEEAEAYELWFRAKVQASRDDPRPSIPHDAVMAEMRQLLEDKRKDQDAARMAA